MSFLAIPLSLLSKRLQRQKQNTTMVKRLFALGSLILLLFGAKYIHAQQLLRKEINAPDGIDIFRTHNAQEDGFLLLFPSSKFDPNSRQFWEFYIVDTNFKEHKKYDYAIPPGLDLVDIKEHEKGTTILWERENKSDKLVFIMDLNFMKGPIDSLHLQIPKRSKVNQLACIGNSGIISIREGKKGSELLFFDLENKSNRLIDLNQDEDKEFVTKSLITKNDHSGYQLLFQEFQDRKWIGNHVWDIDTKGNIQERFRLEPDLEKKVFPIEMKLLPNADCDYAIVGLYTNTSNKTKKNKIKDLLPEGYYMTYSSNNSTKEYLIPFSNYESKKQSKKERRQNKQLKQNMLHNNSYIKNDHIYLFTESYYPKYRTVTRMDYDFYGRLEPRTEKVFEGYCYTKGVKSVFNMQGELVYTNTIDLHNLMEEKIKKHLCHYDFGDEQVLGFIHQSKVTSCIFKGGECIFPAAYDPLETGYQGDRVEDSYQMILEHWYGEYFIVHGYQTISNQEDSSKNRSVFFISKVEFK